MIAIIDYGVGNLFSLKSSLRSLGLKSLVSSEPEALQCADHIILPGVGAFGDAMAKLKKSGMYEPLQDEARSGKPLLGICLGMQMLFERSFEYGEHEGLSLIEGEIRSFSEDFVPAGLDLKIPHIGWNSLKFIKPSCPLLKYSREGEYVYYVHSFLAKNCGPSIVACSEYGVSVPGVVQSANVFGTQFHPEKSGEAGLRMLAAFAEI